MTLTELTIAYFVAYPAACVVIAALLFNDNANRAIIPAGVFALALGLVWPLLFLAGLIGYLGSYLAKARAGKDTA